MQIEWESRQGSERESNRDAGGACLSGEWLLAVIVDEATTAKPGSGLAEAIVRGLIDGWNGSPDGSAEQIVTLMKGIHASLRRRFASDKATFAVLITHLETENAIALFCGDCRVGVVREQKITWLTRPHTLGTVLSSLGRHDNNERVDQVVTRTFNARRFSPPDIVDLGFLEKGAYWVLATDGCTELDHEVRCVPGKDDASCLRIGKDGRTISSNSNSNWYCPSPFQLRSGTSSMQAEARCS